ncbi:MAG: alpha/beta hydrolase [Actinomycetota bacterium]
MERRTTVGVAGAAVAAIGGGLALRRSLRGLSEADGDRPLDTDTTFPPGEVATVATGDGGVIATESTGDGPTVVLVHGITSSRQDWGPLARDLVGTGHTVIGVDQRGHGDSDPGAEGYSSTRLGADLADVLTTLDLRNVVLVGHSMGGIAALTFAVEEPAIFAERVRSLVLVATTPRTSRLLVGPPRWLVDLALGRESLSSIDWVVHRPVLARTLFGRFGSRRLVDAALVAAQRARPVEVARNAAGLAGYDVTDRLSSITTPTRCFYGTHDLITPPKGNRRIARSIPDATATEIGGAGHLLIWTHVPELAAEIIAAVAAGVDGAGASPAES